MKRHLLLSAVVAVVVALIAVRLGDGLPDDDADEIDIDALAAELASHPLFTGAGAPRQLSYTMELVEDSWVNGSRTTGSDNKPLASTSNSICFLTKIEIKGIEGPEDTNACAITVDEFTGFWEVTATVPEGSRSEVRCNARCLVWE